jgi:3',5'-cyclic AMP phosphodiesterase CpdA
LHPCLWVALLALGLTACGADEDGTGSGGGGGGSNDPPEPLPALSKAPLTTETTLVPKTTPVTADLSKNVRLPDDMDAFLSEGYGDYTTAPGEPVLPRTLDDSTPPAAGPNAKLVARFVHFTDTQLADDESPARIVNGDGPLSPTSGAFRPQEGHECRIMNAAVRTVNRLSEDSKIDFVLLGGDNADNAQTNEVDWVLSILSGAESVECDSGDDDDPMSGGNNDPKDPFIAEGLTMPWLWVTGNHDVLNQGNFPPESMTPEYVGTSCSTGTRDWSQPGGPVYVGDVVADDRRTPLSGENLMTKVKADGDGHGITDDDVASGYAYYTADIPGTNLRILAMDTAARTGSADGLIHQSDLDDFIVPALDQAAIDGKIVIVTSHHSSAQLTDGVGFGGITQADAITPDDLRAALASHPNVLMHLAGHTHHHKATKIDVLGVSSYWEVESAALADWPNQLRMIEIWDQDNGFYSIRMIALDYQTENDPIAEDGRERSIVDYTAGWIGSGAGETTDRNVELYVPKP